GGDDFRVAINPTVSGNVDITNLDNGSLVLTTGIKAKNVTLETGADLTTTEGTVIQSTQATTLTSDYGDVVLDGGVKAGTALVAKAKGNVAFNAATQSGNTITAQAGKDITINAALTAGESLTALAQGEVLETAAGSINTQAVTTTTGGSVVLENTDNRFAEFTANGIKGADINGSLLVKASGGADLSAAVNAHVNGDVELTNLADGELVVSTPIQTKATGDASGHVFLDANGGITTGGQVLADGDIQMTSKNNYIENKDSLVSGGDIVLDAATGIQSMDGISAEGTITMKSAEGGISAYGNVKAVGDIDITVAGDGDISLGQRRLTMRATGAMLLNLKQGISICRQAPVTLPYRVV
ncbi:MAG: hypothetical protein J5492_01140, partial [Oxalobacter sp.]|nr:hypothetical protein [Oxalobacter sp.]